jgi:hypothetical protein
MTSGGKSLYRQQPKEDDLQRPHSVRNLVIGTGVLGAITIICWYGTGASQSGTSANGFIACSAANCPAPTALPMESPAAAQANANGGSSGNPKAIGGSTKRSGSVTGLPPIISALLNPPTTGTTVGPVAHPSTSAPGTTPTTPAAGKTSSTPTTSKAATPTATATTATPAPTPDTTPTTVPPTTVPPTTVPPTTVPPTTVPPPTILPSITITASLTVDPTSPGPTTS